MEKLEFITTIKGRVIQVLESRGGTSARTGNSWKVQSFVIEEVGVQYPQKIVFEVFGEDKIEKFNIQQGVCYNVSVTFSADEYNGKYYQKIRAWNVTPIEVQQDAYAVPASSSSVAPESAPMPTQGVDANANPFAPEEGGENGDDLPF